MYINAGLTGSIRAVVISFSPHSAYGVLAKIFEIKCIKKQNLAIAGSSLGAFRKGAF